MSCKLAVSHRCLSSQLLDTMRYSIAGTPLINMPWQYDQYSTLDFSIPEPHFGTTDDVGRSIMFSLTGATDVEGLAMGSTDHLIVRKRALNNAIAFPNSSVASYDNSILTANDDGSGAFTINHKAAGADMFRFSADFAIPDPLSARTRLRRSSTGQRSTASTRETISMSW